MVKLRCAADWILFTIHRHFILNFKSLSCHESTALVQNERFRRHSDRLAYLDESFLVSTREVLGLSLRFFPLSHHLDVKLREWVEADFPYWDKQPRGLFLWGRGRLTPDILLTSSRGVCSPGSPSLSQSLYVRCRRQETPDTCPRHLEGWEPSWALQGGKDRGGGGEEVRMSQQNNAEMQSH